tara:strand:- start:429 stop:602 length:174 start_codon:yes stop_codon:yes gene_type:complete
MKSPCVKICTMKKGWSLCIGCFRTIEQIAKWKTYSDEEKRKVIKESKIRKSIYIVRY